MTPTSSPIHRPTIAVLIACGLFVAANFLVPLTLGDVYPFTIAPMFRDTPQVYCNYRVYAPDGTLLADNSTRHCDPNSRPDPFLLRRYYDGNPVGLGVGLCPPKTLDEFGAVAGKATVRRHFEQCLTNHPDLAYVDVEQEVIGPIDAWRVGVQRINHWRVTREEASP